MHGVPSTKHSLYYNDTDYRSSGTPSVHTLLSPGALSFVKYGFARGSIFECKIVRTWGTRHFKTEREKERNKCNTNTDHFFILTENALIFKIPWCCFLAVFSDWRSFNL